MKEIKVYGIDVSDIDIDVLSFNDEQFMDEAEQQGLVWSLKGFEGAFNNEEIPYDVFIRIII